MKRWIATLATAALLGAAACAGEGEETETDGGAGTGTATEVGAAGGPDTQPAGGPLADTTGLGAGAVGGDTAAAPAAGH